MPSPEIEIDALKTQMTAIIVRDAEGSPETRSDYDSRYRARSRLRLSSNSYCSFAYSALASLRMGMLGSASFQSVRKSW
jgi:hypothetical protein